MTVGVYSLWERQDGTRYQVIAIEPDARGKPTAFVQDVATGRRHRFTVKVLLGQQRRSKHRFIPVPCEARFVGDHAAKAERTRRDLRRQAKD